jgi:hypothetical protein
VNAVQNRVDKLFKDLSVEERGQLRLRWWKEDVDYPLAFYRATPNDQLPEVNRLTRLFNTIHREATWYAIWLHARLDAATERLMLLGALQLWTLDAPASVSKSRAPLAEDLPLMVAADLTRAWGELLALEEVIRKTAEHFGGEEPIHPDARELLDKVKAVVLTLVEHLRSDFDLVLPDEPDEGTLAWLSARIGKLVPPA